MQRDDTVLLRHVLDAARKAVQFISGRKRSDLQDNEMLALSLVRLLEIIGEAANGVSDAYRAQHPQVPWQKMVALRNRLIHGYSDINLDIVWDTVAQDLPMLIERLQSIIPSQPPAAQ
jgi:uncharacterized protein with HEPN domain